MTTQKIMVTLFITLILTGLTYVPISGSNNDSNNFWSNLEQASTDILIGEVISKTSFWGNEGKSTLIFTQAELKVIQYLKSSIERKDTDYIIYQGGAIGDVSLLSVVEPYGPLITEIGQTVKVYGTRDLSQNGAIQVTSIEPYGSTTYTDYQTFTWIPVPLVGEDMKLGFWMLDGSSWDSASFPIQYWVNPNCPDVTGEETQVQTAVNKWTAVASSRVSFSYKGTTTIDYSFKGDGSVVYWAYYGSGSPPRIAITNLWRNGIPGEIVEVDIELNTYHKWSKTNPAPPYPPDYYDIQSCILHEWGHGIGLGHLNYDNPWEDFSSYAMWKSLAPRQIRRSLGAGDTRGAQYLYPQYTKPTVDIVLPVEYAHVNKGVSFQIKASASCSDGIKKVEYKMTRKATGDYIEDSGWTAMTPSGGYYVATFTPYSTWSAPGDYWIIVRALSNRGTSSQRMYGYHWHTVYLDP